MEQFETQFKNGKKIHMSSDEKSVIRYSLSKFIDLHPVAGVPVIEMPKQDTTIRVSPYLVRSPFTFMHMMKVVTLVLIALLIGGGSLAYASDASLPGDTLYSVKINVTEALGEKLARTPEAKAHYQITRIQKRFAEIKTLQSEGKLTPEREAVVEQVFDAHTEALNETLTTLESQGKNDVILATTAQLIPVLEAYANQTGESQMDTDTASPVTDISETATTPESTASSLSVQSTTSLVNEIALNEQNTKNTDSSDTTTNQTASDKNTGSLKLHKLGSTFIEKIKKEKEHLEAKAQNSSEDMSMDEDTSTTTIDQDIESIGYLFNTLFLDEITPDGDTPVEIDTSVTTSTDSSPDTKSSTDTSQEIQIDFSIK